MNSVQKSNMMPLIAIFPHKQIFKWKISPKIQHDAIDSNFPHKPILKQKTIGNVLRNFGCSILVTAGEEVLSEFRSYFSSIWPTLGTYISLKLLLIVESVWHKIKPEWKLGFVCGKSLVKFCLILT